MASPDYLKQRAIELSADRSAGQVLKVLHREFPNDNLPDERTIRRWRQNLPRIDTKDNVTSIPSNISGSLQEHHKQLADIATSLLDNALANVSCPGWTTNRTRQVKYLIPSGNAASRYAEITKSQLASRLNKNIASVNRNQDWFFRNCFVPHLKSELPRELSTELFFKVAKEHPYELIQTLRILAARKTFKGNCPACP